MPSFFMMTDHIPKTSLQVEDAQTYLNLNFRKDPVYLAFGWLDSVGFLRPKSVGDFGFDMPVFLDFTTDFGVRGDDHALTHARLQLTAAGANAKSLSHLVLAEWGICQLACWFAADAAGDKPRRLDMDSLSWAKELAARPPQHCKMPCFSV